MHHHTQLKSELYSVIVVGYSKLNY